MSWNADGKIICEVCEKRPAVAVCSTSIPYSAAYCRECAEVGADPYWVVVSNTAAIGGMEHAAEHWHDQVRRTLEHLGKTREEFDAAVVVVIQELSQ